MVFLKYAAWYTGVSSEDDSIVIIIPPCMYVNIYFDMQNDPQDWGF